MPAVFIALPCERNADFPRRAGRRLDLPENLHFYFIVRKSKWISLSVKESKSESERNKEREFVLNWDTLRQSHQK